MRLEDAKGFVFDVDGTLVHRTGPTSVEAMPGAVELLERIEASGRQFAIFTNGSHVEPDDFARQLRRTGLPVADGRVLTPLCSVQAYLERLPGEPRLYAFVTDEARVYLESVGVRLVDGSDPEQVDAVFVAHADSTDFDRLERAARAVLAGARLLTGSYVPAYAGANGPILSRGAMITAAIAKASSTRPTIVGKPSRAAVRAMRERLGVRSEELAVVGDDTRLEVELGHLGGSFTVLVRSGISGSVDVSSLPAKQRPHLAVDTVADLLPLV